MTTHERDDRLHPISTGVYLYTGDTEDEFLDWMKQHKGLGLLQRWRQRRTPRSLRTLPRLRLRHAGQAKDVCAEPTGAACGTACWYAALHGLSTEEEVLTGRVGTHSPGSSGRAAGPHGQAPLRLGKRLAEHASLLHFRAVGQRALERFETNRGGRAGSTAAAAREFFWLRLRRSVWRCTALSTRSGVYPCVRQGTHDGAVRYSLSVGLIAKRQL